MTNDKTGVRFWPSRERLRALFNLYISACLVLVTTGGMTGPASAQSAAKRSAPPISEAALNTAKTGAEELQALRRKIDPATLSLDAMAERLDFEPKAAIDHVTSEIGFLPYAGSMRGDLGTLAAGSGSALDQALLLGGLLEIMGLDVALAFGTLEEAEASRLWSESASVRAPTPAIGADDIPEVDRTASRGDATEKSIGIAIERQTKSYLDLAEPLIAAASDDPLDDLRDHMRDNYVWVRYRDRPDTPWIDVHPAFGAGSVTPSPAPTRYGSVRPPDEARHVFSMSVMLEVRTGDSKQQKRILATAPHPVSDLASAQVGLMIAPVGVDMSRPAEAQAATYFLPTLDGEVVSGSQAFSPFGELAPAMAVARGQTGAATGSLFGGIDRDLAKIGSSAEAELPRITGLWLETSYRDPMGEIRSRRPLLDLDGVPTENGLQATDGMLRMIVDVNIGETDLARISDYQLDQNAKLLQRLPRLLQVATGAAPMDALRSDTDVVASGAAQTSPVLALSQGVMSPARFADGVVLPRRALIIAHRQSVTRTSGDGAPQIFNVIDIVHNDTVVLGTTGDRGIDREATARLGIHQSITEGLLLNGKVADARALYVSAQPVSIKTERDLDAFADAQVVDAATRARMSDDLREAGLLLVGGEDAAGDRHWLKLEPSTGRLLAMSVHGGQATENVTLTALISKYGVSVVFFAVGITMCAFSYGAGLASGTETAVCVGVNTVLAGAGVALGFAGVVAEAAAAARIAGGMLDIIFWYVGNGLADGINGQ